MTDDQQPVSMRVEVCEGIDENQAIAVAHAVAEIVPDPAAVTIILSRDLEADARRLLGGAAGERDANRVWSQQTAGVTIGSNIVISSHVFEEGHHTYVASHEAFHAALAQRDESTHTLRARGVRSDGLSEDIVALAGVGAEEYRVDVALGERFRVEYDYEGEFVSLVADFARRTSEASAEYQRTRDTAVIMRTMGGLFQELARHAITLAALLTHEELVAVAGRVPEDVASAVLGDGFLGAMSALQAMPSADVEASRSELDALALRYAEALDEWLARIGFRISDEPDGAQHFALLEAPRWDAFGAAWQP